MSHSGAIPPNPRKARTHNFQQDKEFFQSPRAGPVARALLLPLRRSLRAVGERKILIIDDDLSVRECYGRLFRRQGFEPLLESNGASVEKNLENYRNVGVMILDYRMPGINGLALLRRLRERQFSAAALLVTATSTPEMIEEARRLGVRRVFSKPVDVSLLVQEVREVLASATVAASVPLARNEA